MLVVVIEVRTSIAVKMRTDIAHAAIGVEVDFYVAGRTFRGFSWFTCFLSHKFTLRHLTGRVEPSRPSSRTLADGN